MEPINEFNWSMSLGECCDRWRFISQIGRILDFLLLFFVDTLRCPVDDKLISTFRGTWSDTGVYETQVYAYLKTFRFTGSPALYIECDVRMCHGRCPVIEKKNWFQISVQNQAPRNFFFLIHIYSIIIRVNHVTGVKRYRNEMFPSQIARMIANWLKGKRRRKQFLTTLAYSSRYECYRKAKMMNTFRLFKVSVISFGIWFSFQLHYIPK